MRNFFILPRDVRRLHARYRGQCAYCDSKATSLDHVIPISRGGVDGIGNLIPACWSCNSSKHQKLIIEWQCGLPALIDEMAHGKWAAIVQTALHHPDAYALALADELEKRGVAALTEPLTNDGAT